MNKKMMSFGISCRMMTALIVLVLFVNVHAIRVYEGTNFPAPVTKIQKSTGLAKKSSYISKRSWSVAEDGLKLNQKADRRLESKYKDFNKRNMADAAPSLYKIKFTDKSYMQYLKYIREIPRLEEYTFCLWYKPTNLTYDHTLFSYSLNKNEILIRLWISHFDSTLRLAIRENVVYKVPTNVREFKWHHICQAWNGVLGKVQIFLDGRRIGEEVLSHYKGTYIPEGGEVTLGTDINGLGKRLGDGISGEMFGFNLVDESVPHDQATFLNSQYRPRQAAVPPFKKLPPIKKTYNEIKAYISTLPNDSTDSHKKNEAILAEEPNMIKKPSFISTKRNRGSHRIRYPPLRKVVVYNREDRQLPLDETSVELNKTNSVKPIEVKNQTVIDENYSIHSYRFGKQEKKLTNYEIYEPLEDDDVLQPTEEFGEKSLEKKAKQNFNLYTAREANKIYTLSSSIKDLKKPKFHFETRERKPEANKRSFNLDEPKIEMKPMEKSDSIPVYEIEVVESRKRRETGDRKAKQFVPKDTLGDVSIFRRLPQIPDSFINLFSANSTKTELEEKLDQFFPENGREIGPIFPPEKEPKTADIDMETTEASKNYIPVEHTTTQETTNLKKPQQELPEEMAVESRTEFSEPAVVPEFSPMPPLITEAADQPQEILSNPKPINFPMYLELQELRRLEEIMHPQREGYPAPDIEREFDVSSGTDLVMRSYGECTSERGSPVSEKHHLIISWADTPVRIFGGAQVESARNECGNF